MSMSSSSLASAASLIHPWVMWFVCASVSAVVSHEDRTVYMLFVCLCMQQGDNVHVCWSVSELEVTRLSLAWYFAPCFFFFFSLTCQFSWKTECQTCWIVQQNQAAGGEFKSQEECTFILQCWSCYIHIFVAFLDNRLKYFFVNQ